MVFHFHYYHQKDWWRLTCSYKLGTKAKQKKSWLLVLIRVEKTISQPSWPVFPSSVRAVFFSHCISHTFSSEIPLSVRSGAVLLDSLTQHTRAQESQLVLWNAVSWTTADAVNIPRLSGYIPPTAQETTGNWSFPWRGDTFEQDPSWGKAPVCLSPLLCEGSGKQLPAGPRASTDTVPKEKCGGQQQRGFGMCWFMWVLRRKAGSYCFWWVLNCSMDCSMALNGPYPEAALGSIRSRIHASLFVFLIPTHKHFEHRQSL